PFNIDVTTQDPGNRADRRTCQIVIGGDGKWLGADAGGVAPLGGFFNGAPNTGYAFSDLFGSDPKNIAEVAAHEAGHLFDLEHHSLFDPTGTKVDEYDPGNGFTAPIMGVAYYAQRGIWANAPSSAGPNVIQNDLTVLSNSANGFGFRADDYGGTQFSASALSPNGSGVVTAGGIIGRSNDIDAFTISSPNGTLQISLNNAQFGPMLDASIRVADPFGNTLGEAKTSSLDETLSVVVAPGSYTIYVSGAGNYGDLGQYTLTAQLPGGGFGSDIDHYLVTGTDFDDNISITLVENEYKLDLNGEISTIDPGTIKQFDILAGDGNDVITIGPGVTGVYALLGGGSDTFNGGDGNDTVTGSSGNDLIFGGEGDDRLAGSAGHDILVGGLGRDRLYGDAGNDVITGGAGVDRLYGGDDHDVLSGESSADKAYGQDGNDTVYGGRGNDLLNGGEGLDQMYGGDDDDVLFARDLEVDLVNGGAGFDSGQTDEDEDLAESLEDLLA
ncbi:MAG: calcium-binding protein, partial [Tepidisphaeraceae bacterium]